MSHEEMIRRISAVTDAEAARMVSAPVRAHLAEQIMATEPGPAVRRAPSRRRLALFVGAPLTAAACAATAFLVAGGTPSGHRTPGRVQLAALSFSTQGKYLVVKVKDPYADPKRYAEEFKRHGLKIQLSLVPASPSVVGTVVMSEGGAAITMIPAKGKCYSGGGACPVGVRIPIGYRGEAHLVFGRAPRPGEVYNSTNSAFAPGEELHCVDIRNRTVGEALTVLGRHKVSVALFNYESRPNYAENTPDRTKIPDTWYVSSAEPYAPHQVMLFVGPNKPGHRGDDTYYRRLMDGCR